MIRAVFLVLLACLAVPRPAALALDAQSCRTDAAANVKACAELLDSLGKGQLRPDVPKPGFRTDLGLQFHGECLKIAAEKGIKADKAEKLLRAWTDRLYRKVTQDCAAKHPALAKYIFGDPNPNAEAHFLGWLTQARRTVVTCSRESQDKLKFAAFNVISKANFGDVIPKKASDGIPVRSGKSDSLPRAHEPVVLFSLEALVTSLQAEEFMGGLPDTDALLAHEIFHSTAANNLTDHNDREKKYFDEKATCSSNIADDRVNIISGLCMGDTMHFGGRTAARAMFERMNHCGAAKGCVDTFTSEIPTFGNGKSLADDLENSSARKYTPSVPLDKREAADLCEEIHDDGYCQHIRETQGEVFGKGQPALKAVGDKVLARLGQVLPVATNDIPPGFLNAYPELAAEAKALDGSPCFAAAFYNGYSADKPLYLRMDEAHGVSPKERPAGLNSWGLTRFNQARDKLESSDRCKNASDDNRERVEKLLSGIEKKMQLAFNSSTFGDLAQKRYLGELEQKYKPGVYGDESAERERVFAGLMGPELVREYHDALKRYHPDSPDFDCVAAGLSKYRAAKLAKAGLAAKPGPKVTCP